MSGNRPDYTLDAFPLKLAGWKTENDGREHWSFRLTKRYKDDKDGEWKDTPYLNMHDLPRASLLYQRAYIELGIKKETD